VRARGRPAVARGVLACVASAFACAAQAQLAASVSVTSEYRFRGVSQADGRPALQLALEGDAATGWYGGATATQVAVSEGHHYVELDAYGGKVLGTSADALRPELGVRASHFAGDPSYDYGEAYAGLVAARWNLRAYASPDYFGRGTRTLYVELNADRPLGDVARLFAHAGVIAGRGGPAGLQNSKARFDASAGVVFVHDRAQLQLAGVGATEGGPYPAVFNTHRGAFIATASLAF
jgi:uncharacterized protein (TIGR02001 family)